MGLFYYTGHGVQADGINYLIPVDAQLEANAIDVSRVLRAMRLAQNEMNIVILDACRDNPLPHTRGMGRGMARMDAPDGRISWAAAQIDRSGARAYHRPPQRARSSVG